MELCPNEPTTIRLPLPDSFDRDRRVESIDSEEILHALRRFLFRISGSLIRRAS